MHSGPIILPDNIKAQCEALMNLATMLRLFSISEYVEAMDIQKHILKNRTSILDLQKVIYLCNLIIEHKQVHPQLKQEITELKKIIDMFIVVASQPTRPCGRWLFSTCEFDDDQLL